MAPVALFEAVAILGTAAAWYGGSARLPFVAGIDNYLPRALGRLHTRYNTPYVALIAFAVLAALLILMSNAGASVGEAFLTLLSISVVLQLIPNLYMFAALVQLSRHRRYPHYERRRMAYNGASGLAACILGISLAFIPSESTTHILAYEIKLMGTILLVLGIALLLYFRAARSARTEQSAALMKASTLHDLTDLS